jgi:hypothetical protein
MGAQQQRAAPIFDDHVTQNRDRKIGIRAEGHFDHRRRAVLKDPLGNDVLAAIAHAKTVPRRIFQDSDDVKDPIRLLLLNRLHRLFVITILVDVGVDRCHRQVGYRIARLETDVLQHETPPVLRLPNQSNLQAVAARHLGVRFFIYIKASGTRAEYKALLCAEAAYK